MTKIDAQIRDKKDSLEFLKAKGLIPAVYYGPKNKAESIVVDRGEFIKIFKEAGESTTVTLGLPSGSLETLIHAVDIDPAKGFPRHVDFMVIDAKKPVHVAVPLEFEGVSEAVKTGGGTLVKVLHEIEIEALPKDLPHMIVVDISNLKTLDDQITAGDIKLPNGVSLQTEADAVVASISTQVEESEEPAAAPDLSSIETEKRGKKEEDEA